MYRRSLPAVRICPVIQYYAQGFVTDEWFYRACGSCFDARLNISFRRADELERTFFSILF
jgi:hypothetical protein